LILLGKKILVERERNIERKGMWRESRERRIKKGIIEGREADFRKPKQIINLLY